MKYKLPNGVKEKSIFKEKKIDNLSGISVVFFQLWEATQIGIPWHDRESNDCLILGFMVAIFLQKVGDFGLKRKHPIKSKRSERSKTLLVKKKSIFPEQGVV